MVRRVVNTFQHAPLRVKLLAPVLAGGLVALAVVLAFLLRLSTSQLEDELHRRARRVASVLIHAARVVDDPGDFSRIVGSLGGEPDIRHVVMVVAERSRVAAASMQGWAGRSVQELPDTSVRDVILTALKSGEPSSRFDSSQGQFDLAVPFRLADRAPGLPSAYGTIAVRIDGRETAESDRASFTTLGMLLLAALAGTTGLSYLILTRHVIRPATAIRKAIARRTDGDRTAYAPVLARDVLGEIATTLNRMVDAVSAGEERYRSLVEGSLQGIHIHQEARIRFANRSLARIFGYASERELIGQPYRILLAPHEVPRFEGYEAARMLGEPAPSRVELQGLRQDGVLIWVDALISVVSWDGAPASLVTTIDITERKRAEEALRARLREMESMMDVSRALAASLDTQAVLQLIVERAARLLGTAKAGVAILEREGDLPSLRFVALLGLSPQFSRLVRPQSERQGTTPAAISRRRPVWSADLLTDPAFDLLPDTRASVETEGYRAVLSVPLLVGDRVLGALAVYRDSPGPFSETEIHLLETFAAHAAIALENARLFTAARRAPRAAVDESGTEPRERA